MREKTLRHRVRSTVHDDDSARGEERERESYELVLSKKAPEKKRTG